MPIERIYDESGMYDVVISWGRGSPGEDGNVQIGVETHDGRPLEEHLRDGRELADAGLGDPVVSFRGVWGSFSRVKLNHAIFVLRRARDQAFGKDQ